MKVAMRGRKVTAKAFLPNQFPLEVVAVWYPAEPDVGIMSPYCDIESLSAVSRRSGKLRHRPFWRELTKAEHDYVMEQIPLPSFAVKPRPLGRGYKAWRREATLSCGVRRECAISKTCSTPPGFVSIRLTSRLKPWLFSSGARVGSGTTLLFFLAICIARPAKG